MRALREAARHEFPTGDIQEMLREVESQYCYSDSGWLPYSPK